MASKETGDMSELLQNSIKDERVTAVYKALVEKYLSFTPNAAAHIAVEAVDAWLEANELAIVPKKATEWMGMVAMAGQPLQGHPSLQERIELGYALAVKAAPVLKPPRKP